MLFRKKVGSKLYTILDAEMRDILYLNCLIDYSPMVFSELITSLNHGNSAREGCHRMNLS